MDKHRMSIRLWSTPPDVVEGRTAGAHDGPAPPVAFHGWNLR